MKMSPEKRRKVWKKFMLQVWHRNLNEPHASSRCSHMAIAITDAHQLDGCGGDREFYLE